MQCKTEAIESYVNGKKFKRLRDNNQDKFLEHLSSSKIHRYIYIVACVFSDNTSPINFCVTLVS